MSLMVLDYDNRLPTWDIIGRERNLAWPVHTYRVTLPKLSKGSSDLNSFERVVLRLIDAGSVPDAELLALETCLPPHLIQCVLLRLRDKSYIDENNKIVDDQREKWQINQRLPLDFITAILFRDAVGGKVLPFLHLLDNGDSIRKNEKDNIKKIYFNRTHPIHIEARDVIFALRGMQKKLGKNTSDLPSAQFITIAKTSELNYLECAIAIEKRDMEYRIADPFGFGYSSILENSFQQLLEKDAELEKWLSDWKKTLSNFTPKENKNRQDDLFDNDKNRRLYPKLIHSLRIPDNSRYRSIDRIYSSIEWALFYFCAHREYQSAIHQLKIADSKQSDLLKNAAESVLLQAPMGGFYPVKIGKLDDFLNEKAEFGTVLSIALIIASADNLSPLRNIATKYPDLIKRLFDIKSKRDEKQHGKGKVNDVKLEEDSFMKDFISTLIPKMRFFDILPMPIQDQMDELLMDARTSIQIEFGFATFNFFGVNQQSRLIHIEKFWLTSSDNIDSITFVCDIYAALECTLRGRLENTLPPDIDESDYFEIAKIKAKEAHLGELARCFLTVKQSSIRETLRGNDQSLQACVVALLIIEDALSLEAIASAQPSFIADLADIVDKRGHGNEPLILAHEHIKNMRAVAYKTLKTLLEI